MVDDYSLPTLYDYSDQKLSAETNCKFIVHQCEENFYDFIDFICMFWFWLLYGLVNDVLPTLYDL